MVRVKDIIERFAGVAGACAVIIRGIGTLLVDVGDAIDLALGWEEALYIPEWLDAPHDVA